MQFNLMATSDQNAVQCARVIIWSKVCGQEKWLWSIADAAEILVTCTPQPLSTNATKQFPNRTDFFPFFRLLLNRWQWGGERGICCSVIVISNSY